MSEEGIYADLPEDDIYADLEDELNKAGYDAEQMVEAPALPNRNQMVQEAPKTRSSFKMPKKEKEKAKPVAAPAQPKNKVAPKSNQKQPATKSKPKGVGPGPVIPSDMLNQRRLLKKVERMEPRKVDEDEPKIDFRANLRKVAPKEKEETHSKQPPPLLKPKPSLTSIGSDQGKIRYKRLPLTEVELSNPPIINREKKPRLLMDTEAYDDEDDDVYDDVTNVIDQDVYDDVENISGQMNGNFDLDQDTYDDVENVIDRKPEISDPQDVYDDLDLENQNPDLVGEYYDDVKNVGIARPDSEHYDDVENVRISRNSAIDSENMNSPFKNQPEELYDELPDSDVNPKETGSPVKKISATQEKKRKAEEVKFQKKLQEQEKRRQKELEKYTKEMEKKRKVFMEYYNLKESDKPLMVAQVTCGNDLRGKQNLEVDIGDIVHVLCKAHKKMPKGAWLAEKSDRSAIGFILPSILNQNMLHAFDD